MALNRAQLVMGNSSQGVVLSGQTQGVTQGTGVSIAANGAISFDSTSATGVLKTNNPTAYNAYVWPTTIGAAGQQLQLGAGGALSWEDPGGIPWTAKGQLVVGTGLNTSTILNVGSNASILIADSSTTSGLNYTANYVATTGPTSAANLPAGAAATRPATPPAGAFRYNSTDTSLEFYNGVSWETVASSGTNLFVEKTSDTGIALIPAGTSAQRPVASTYAGGFRFNSDLDTIEFSDGVAWKQLVMLNNLTGYNAYIWPNADGAYGSFLQTDAAGNLSWKNPAFVGTTAPTPASDGMLWYDCNVGYLKVYQSCVAPNGWTKVAEPGLPILTANMSASPAFSSGSGTSGSPYVVTTSTVTPGDSVLIPNTITVTGLAPNQYVSIVDQNAVTNGGRYHFTNNFADSSGTLVFNIIFIDAPNSTSGTNYTANIRVGYATGYIQSLVNVLTSFSITSPGSISGTPAAGQTLTYISGTTAGGTAPITTSWVWKDDTGTTLQTGGFTYVLPGTVIGKKVYVAFSAVDATPTTITANTSQTATVTQSVFPNWTVAAPTQIPQTVSGTWADGTTNLTAGGCILISTDNVTFNQGPTPVSNGNTLYMKWNPTGPTCGDAPSGTNITGTLTDGTYLNSYSLLLDRNPNSFDFTNLTGQSGSTAITSNSVTISGTNAPGYITYTAGATPLTSVQASVGGGAYVSIPTSGTSLTIDPGQTLQIKGTTGSGIGVAYTLTINIGTTSDAWSVTTATAVPTVATPIITSPVNGSTGLNPGLNCTPGVTLSSSAFSSSNGAGTDHASSDWEVASNPSFTTIVFSATADTVNKTSILVPIANLAISTTYYCRVRYTSGTAGGGVVTTSAYSTSTYNWQTTNNFVPAIGTAMCGGYFYGQLMDSGTKYNLIIAPKADSAFKVGPNDGYPVNAATANSLYGKPGSDAMNSASYPQFQWVRSLSIGGYTDWYIYSIQEAVILYQNLKGYNLAPNNTTTPTQGEVTAAVPPLPNYSNPGPPYQTTLAPWIATTGSEYLNLNATGTITNGDTSAANFVGKLGFSNNSVPGQTVSIDPLRGGYRGGTAALPPGTFNSVYNPIRRYATA